MSADGRTPLSELERVLKACLDYLPEANYGAGALQVLDAWTEEPSSVHVVFRREDPPSSVGVVGYRSDVEDFDELGGPEDTGVQLACDMSEPLGAVVLRKDPTTGISWVGVVPPEPFPIRPGLAERL